MLPEAAATLRKMPGFVSVKRRIWSGQRQETRLRTALSAHEAEKDSTAVESRTGAVALPRFPSPLVERSVRISRTTLSDWLHRKPTTRPRIARE